MLLTVLQYNMMYLQSSSMLCYHVCYHDRLHTKKNSRNCFLTFLLFPALFNPNVFNYKATQCNLLERESWLLTLIPRSSNTDTLAWQLGSDVNPKASVLNNLGKRLKNPPSFSKKLHHVALNKTYLMPLWCWWVWLTVGVGWPGNEHVLISLLNPEM